MRTGSSIIAALAAGLTTVSALSPAEWRAQSIYQIVTDRFAVATGVTPSTCTTEDELGTYCNGTFVGIIDKLDYIQDMGFTALWISPVVKQITGDTEDGSGYHGYWAQDIYQINSHMGTSEELQELSAELHDRGMYLMVDVVVNDMGYFCGDAENGDCGPQGTVNYSIYNPFNSEQYFHPFCEIDYDNATSVLVCWEGDEIVPLPDLRTENTTVQTMWNDWITEMVANYSIDGLRIDSLQQSGSAFFPDFYKATGDLYMVGEVFNGDPTYVCPYQQAGMPGVLNYPAYYWITQAFEDSSGSMANLADGIADMQADCADVTLLGSFLENQDNVRFPSLTGNMGLAKNAIAFTMLQDGIPIIYYGQEQHLDGGSVPYNREALWATGGYNTSSPLYKMIKKVNHIRTHAISVDSSFVTYEMEVPYYDDHTIVTRKGVTGAQVVAVFSNLGANTGTTTMVLDQAAHGFTALEEVVDVLGCTTMKPKANGELHLKMTGNHPMVLFPAAELTGTSICAKVI